MNDNQFKKIIDRLDKLIYVVALASTKDIPMTERMVLLNKCGFKSPEIAEILGTTPAAVRLRLSRLRRRDVVNE
ncbi:MAG: sigma factor-like helix-turn-helix DNA-binding protein [Candidatus Bathyarchaeia archaeon]